MNEKYNVVAEAFLRSQIEMLASTLNLSETINFASEEIRFIFICDALIYFMARLKQTGPVIVVKAVQINETQIINLEDRAHPRIISPDQLGALAPACFSIKNFADFGFQVNLRELEAKKLSLK